MKKHIPNSLTLLNLFSGCCGIVACLHNEYSLVPIFIGISLVADFLDGFVARALKVKSELGGQLDSLADMVTFGVLPGMMLYSIIVSTSNKEDCCSQLLPYIGFLYSVFACLRLAKFNLDTRQTVDFIGLNTPSSAILILGLYMQYYSNWQNNLDNQFLFYVKIVTIVIPIILSYLLIAEFRMFSLKGNPFSWKQNKFRFLLIIFVFPQLFIFKWLGLSTIILTYIIFAYLHNVNTNKL